MGASNWIKKEKLRELSLGELQDRAAELKAAMFTNRFQRSSGKLDNYRVIPVTKRRYATIMTLIREKEIIVEKKMSAEEASK